LGSDSFETTQSDCNCCKNKSLNSTLADCKKTMLIQFMHSRGEIKKYQCNNKG